jgi:hypothetical protein
MTFNIETMPLATRKGPASFAQVRAIANKFAKKADGKTMNWAKWNQIKGCLWGQVKDNKLSFDEAHKLLSNKKTLPAKYTKMIKDYLAQQ